jgi:hypothetical protein
MQGQAFGKQGVDVHRGGLGEGKRGRLRHGNDLYIDVCDGASIRSILAVEQKSAGSARYIKCDCGIAPTFGTMKWAPKKNSKNFHVEFNEPEKVVVLY